MRAVTLNLATRPFRNNTVVGTTLVVLSVALVAATVYNLYVYFNYGNAYAQLQRGQQLDRAKLVSLQRLEGSLLEEIKARDFKEIYQRGRFAHDLILRRSFSWTLLFNKLEGVVPAAVMMSAIRPNVTAESIVVRIEGVAKNHGALIDFEDRLLAHPSFSQVFPSNERRLNPHRSEISFILSFNYLPQPAPQEAPAETGGPVAATSPSGAPAASGSATAEAATAGRAVAAVGGEGALPGGTNDEGRVDEGRAGRVPGVTVGRDGLPRSPDVLARLVLAPGGVFDPGAAHPFLERPNEVPVVGSTGEPAPGAPDPGSPDHRVEGDAPGRAGDPSPGDRDGPGLDFVSRPVGEVYRLIEQAHGVRFDIESGVDDDVRITANLTGRSLGDAIALVAGAARHHVVRSSRGVYRVVGTTGSVSIRDPVIFEEDLASSPEVRR